jgi:hypothetical protein
MRDCSCSQLASSNGSQITERIVKVLTATVFGGLGSAQYMLALTFLGSLSKSSAAGCMPLHLEVYNQCLPMCRDQMGVCLCCVGRHLRLWLGLVTAVPCFQAGVV